MTKDILLEKTQEIFGKKYDYSLVPDNFRTKEKIRIICPIHGIFYKTFEKHIGNKQGCPECSGRKRYTTEYFIKKVKTLDHAKDYDYSKTVYVNSKTHIIVTCKEHGDFKITPGHLLSGEGCPKCRYIKSANSKRRSISEVIEESIKIHGDKYDYSLITEYKNDRIKYPILCPQHGIFYQTFNNHIKAKQGCPLCRQSLMENDLSAFFISNDIVYEREKTFPWLVDNKKLRIDFYLPNYNIAIECQGIQHFKPIKALGGEESYKILVKHDNIKRKLCEKNNITLLYYSNIKFDFPYKVITDKKDLLTIIKK